MASELSGTPDFEDSFMHQFPAIRGIQAGKEYYVTMCPLKLVPRLFLFDEQEIPARLRAQRIMNQSRVPAISNYMINNPQDYVFSAITVSIDGDVLFIPNANSGPNSKIGTLKIPMSSRFIINDGQHRRAAIEETMKVRPELGNDTISVVIFLDLGLKRSQQMFADLNKHAVQPTKSLGILYDNRDPLSQMIVKLSESIPIFNGLTEYEKTTISNRSIKFFTLSSIYQATTELIGKDADLENNGEYYEKLACEYWQEVTKNIPDWILLKEKKVSAHELRKEFIHAHGIALHALGRVGNSLIEQYPDSWKTKLKKLREINWSRSNLEFWDGRAIIGGRINKSHTNLVLTTNALKSFLEIELSKEEQKLENDINKRSGVNP